MGLKDRLLSAKRKVWSPITPWMAGEGGDLLVTAGETARTVVSVRGDDDGTAERVVVRLECKGPGLDPPRSWDLGEVPATVGRHELEVTIPAEAPPACAKYCEYRFLAELIRSSGINPDAAEFIDVIGRPEHLYWPEGPRGVGMTLDADTVELGGTVSGRIGGAEKVELGPVIHAPSSPEGKFKALATAPVVDGAFTLVVPKPAPPTLHNGGTASIVWEVRAGEARHVVGVLDPDASAGIRDSGSPGLLETLAHWDRDSAPH
jgi:hypothetical protein